MEVRFTDADLERMETEGAFHKGYSPAIAKAFRKRMQFIRDAVDERDLRQMQSLRFEKLKGDRDHEHSLRLNDQWRLIIEIEPGTPKNTIVVKKIEDYH
jgi:proteic killer suppression protein